MLWWKRQERSRGDVCGVVYLSLFSDLLAFGPIQVERRGLDYSDKPCETSFMLFSFKVMFRLLKLHYLQLSLGFPWTMVRQ